MIELESCLELRRKINDIDDKISILRAAILSPKNQVITGMPRSGNTENLIDRYLIRSEMLQIEKEQALNQLSETWNVVQSKTGALTTQEKELLFFRFVEGNAWKKCAYLMNKKYGGWNINKVFSTYRRILKTL